MTASPHDPPKSEERPPTAAPARSGTRANRLGLWWPCAALGLAGLLVWLATGHAMIGAALVAAAFLLAAGLRATLPTARVGGLHVRSTWLDVSASVTAAANVLGAAGMVGRHIPWQLMGAVNAVLVAVIAVILVADARAARARYWAQRGRPPG